MGTFGIPTALQESILSAPRQPDNLQGSARLQTQRQMSGSVPSPPRIPEGPSSTIGLEVRYPATVPESGSLPRATEQKVAKAGVRAKDSEGATRLTPDSLASGRGQELPRILSPSNVTPANREAFEASRFPRMQGIFTGEVRKACSCIFVFSGIEHSLCMSMRQHNLESSPRRQSVAFGGVLLLQQHEPRDSI